MLQLNPSTRFPIVRKLGDPSDVGTNYVRAVVRNSVLGTTIATIDLTDEGGQRFVGYYQTPATDEMFIDITTTVYSDSGYTTKSEVYSEESETYLIAIRWSLQFREMGDANSKIDYKVIKKLIKEALNEVEKTEPYSDDLLKEKIDIVAKDVKEIKAKEFPEPKEIDLSLVLRAVEVVGKKVDDIPEVEIPEVNFAPVMEKLSSMESTMGTLAKEVCDDIEEHKKDFNEYRTKDAEEKANRAKSLVDLLYGIDTQTKEKMKKEEEDDKEDKMKARINRLKL